MNKTYSMEQLYSLASQWIEYKQQRGMVEAEADKLAAMLLEFFGFVMKQRPKKASRKQPDSPRSL
jgi:hypothetical protein